MAEFRSIIYAPNWAQLLSNWCSSRVIFPRSVCTGSSNIFEFCKMEKENVFQKPFRTRSGYFPDRIRVHTSAQPYSNAGWTLFENI